MLRICENNAVSCWAVTALRSVFFWDMMLCLWVFSSWHFFFRCVITILEDQTTVFSQNIRNLKPPMQHYVLEELIPYPFCCKNCKTHNKDFIYMCCSGAACVPCVNFLHRPVIYIFCQTEFDCPNVSVNVVFGLSEICPLHGMSVLLKF